MAKSTDFRYNTGDTRVPWPAVGENYNVQDLMAVIRFMMKGEGAEYEALVGARKLIMENRPRMAISVYHKFEDFVTLANLVLEMHPDYRISFRHYGFDELETIMYVE